MKELTVSILNWTNKLKWPLKQFIQTDRDTYCTCFHHLLHVCWLSGRHAFSRFYRSRTNVRLGEPSHPPLTHTLPPPSVRLLYNGDKFSFLQLELDIRRPIEIMFGYVLISVWLSVFILLQYYMIIIIITVTWLEAPPTGSDALRDWGDPSIAAELA